MTKVPADGRWEANAEVIKINLKEDNQVKVFAFLVFAQVMK